LILWQSHTKKLRPGCPVVICCLMVIWNFDFMFLVFFLNACKFVALATTCIILAKNDGNKTKQNTDGYFWNFYCKKFSSNTFQQTIIGQLIVVTCRRTEWFHADFKFMFTLFQNHMTNFLQSRKINGINNNNDESHFYRKSENTYKFIVWNI
jgi:hypothetical protein